MTGPAAETAIAAAVHDRPPAGCHAAGRRDRRAGAAGSPAPPGRASRGGAGGAGCRHPGRTGHGPDGDAVRRSRVVGPRIGGPGPRRGRPDQRPDRRGTVHQPQDGQRPRHPHPRQARGEQPDRGGDAGRSCRAGGAGSGGSGDDRRPLAGGRPGPFTPRRAGTWTSAGRGCGTARAAPGAGRRWLTNEVALPSLVLELLLTLAREAQHRLRVLHVALLAGRRRVSAMA